VMGRLFGFGKKGIESQKIAGGDAAKEKPAYKKYQKKKDGSTIKDWAEVGKTA